MQSISNRQLTLLRKLQQKKYRQQEQLFPVEGKRAVEQVLENKVLEVTHLFFDADQKLWETERWQEWAARYPAALVESGAYLELTDTDTPQGVLALCSMPEEAPLDTFAGSDGILLALDRIRDPGNLGTMLRTAAWFGVRGMLIGKGTVDLFHPKVVRSSAGATGAIPFRNSELTEDLDRLERMGWQVLLLDAGPDSIPLESAGTGQKKVVVIGNEAHGIERNLFAPGRIAARIEPGPAGDDAGASVESLNAAIALSIALYACRE